MEISNELTLASASIYLCSIGYDVSITKAEAELINAHIKKLEKIIVRVAGRLAAGETGKAMEDLWMACPDNLWAQIAEDSETTPEMKARMIDVARKQPGVPIAKKNA